MSYIKQYSTANAAGTDRLAREKLGKEVNGDGQILVEAVANDTAITSGMLVSLWPSASGWLADAPVNDERQYMGILQQTPSTAGDRVNVCVGGFCWAFPSSANTCTAWAAEIAVCSNELDALGGGDTFPTTRHIGWICSTGARTTAAGNGIFIFIDKPWPIVDTTT